MEFKKLSIRDYCFIGVFTAIIAICSQISIPMPYGVPMTLQTFAIPLAGIILGTRNGVLSVLIYILLGAIGVPVFAGFTGGLGIIFGKTGGFILTFPILALTASIGAKKNNRIWLTIWLTIGVLINFFFGMLMFSIITSNNLLVSFTYVVIPFIPTAIVKIIMLVSLSKVIKNSLEKNGVTI